MADLFKEQIVKSSVDFKKNFIKIFIGTLVSILILFLIRNLVIGLVIIAVIFFVDYRFLGLFADGFLDRYLEFEYIATNGSFDIDKIINKAKRKKQISIEMQDIQCFSKADGQRIIGLSHTCQEVKDFSNFNNKDISSKYSFVIMQNGKKVQVIFEPNEDMLNVFKTFVPKHAFEN